MRRILITGGTGQVGTELLRCSWSDDVQVVAPNRKELDLSNSAAIAEYVAAGGFSAIVSAGAYTAVDMAEDDVLTAWKVNALAPAALSSTAGRLGIPIVHISTDYVFDGCKLDAYVEDDRVAPLSVYGASKEAGEQAVRTTNHRHIILRTSWVFSPHGSNFVKTMLRLATERPQLKVVSDQRGAPTSAEDIASAVRKTLYHLWEDRSCPTGTYHFVNAGEATWYEFAEEIVKQRRISNESGPIVTAIPSVEFPTRAMRPSNSLLSTEKFERAFGVRPMHWRDALARVLSKI